MFALGKSRLCGLILGAASFAHVMAGDTQPPLQPPPARVPTYTVRDLGVLEGYTQSWPTGLNDHGDAVGYAHRFTFTPFGVLYEDQACLFKDGQVFSLGVSPSNSRANAINNHGQIVGQSGDAFAFLWDNGTITWLGSLVEGGWSEAMDINDLGQVVGWSSTPGPNQHPFLWQNGAMTNLGNLGNGDSAAAAINELGQIIGTFELGFPGHQRGFYREEGSMTELLGLDNVPAIPTGINEAGEIVGYSGAHGVIWRNGQPEYLDEPPCQFCGAPTALNNAEQIVGVVGSVSGPRALIWHQGIRMELKSLIEPDSPFKLEEALDMTGSGQVLCRGYKPGPQFFFALLLTPIDCDVNNDGSVRLGDYHGLPDCMLGPLSDTVPNNCTMFDFDTDLDVDLVDYRSLELAFETP